MYGINFLKQHIFCIHKTAQKDLKNVTIINKRHGVRLIRLNPNTFGLNHKIKSIFGVEFHVVRNVKE